MIQDFPDYQGEEPLILGDTDGYTDFIMMGVYPLPMLGTSLYISRGLLSLAPSRSFSVESSAPDKFFACRKFHTLTFS